MRKEGINSFITKPEGYTLLLKLWQSVFAYWGEWANYPNAEA